MFVAHVDELIEKLIEPLETLQPISRMLGLNIKAIQNN